MGWPRRLLETRAQTDSGAAGSPGSHQPAAKGRDHRHAAARPTWTPSSRGQGSSLILEITAEASPAQPVGDRRRRARRRRNATTRVRATAPRCRQGDQRPPTSRPRPPDARQRGDRRPMPLALGGQIDAAKAAADERNKRRYTPPGRAEEPRATSSASVGRSSRFKDRAQAAGGGGPGRVPGANQRQTSSQALHAALAHIPPQP